MSVQLKKQWCFIELLTSTPVPQRLALLRTVTDQQLDTISEIVLNTLQGQLFVPPEAIQTLKKHKTFLRNLASKDCGIRKKKTSILSNHKLLVHLLQTVKPLLETYVKE